MPINPGKNESNGDWMKRCVPEMMGVNGGTKRPQSQAVAACLTMWRDAHKDGGEVVTRAWSTLEIKKVDAEQRTISGVASTPDTDRMGDIVESLGLEFKNPLPLLWQHRHDQPVGLVKLDKPTEDGVTFTAQLAKVEDLGMLRDRIELAWQSIKSGLVRGVSIGFRALERSFMDGGGVRFIRSEVIELSLVTVPANAQATISTIKSIDEGMPTASGAKHKPETQRTPQMPTPIADQISAFEARRNDANAKMIEMMSKRSEAGETLDDEESDLYEQLEIEVKKLDAHIARLRKLDEQNRAAAVQVSGNNMAEASRSREVVTRDVQMSFDAPLPAISGEVLPPQRQPAHQGGIPYSGDGVIRLKPTVPPGTAFVRFCIAMAVGKGNRWEAWQYAKRRTDWHSSTPEIMHLFDELPNYAMRAAVPAGTTYDSAWAGPLVIAQNIASEFAEFLRPLTIIGRIPGLRRVPFNISLPRATAGTTAGWVGEAAPKPITSMAFDTITLRWAKAAAISVLTEELVRFSNPAAEDVVRTDLARGLTQFVDRQFVDPSVAAVSNVSPASITNGITPITPSGVNMAALRADVKLLFQGILSQNQSTASGVWIMTQQQAVALSLAQNSLGQIIYPGINAQGGVFQGYPVVTSENIPATGGSPADGYPLIFLIADEILLADDGQVTVDASREASLNMDSAPDSPPTAATNMISLWQLNQLGLKVERYITWARRRATAVAWIQNAKYAE